MKKWIILLSLIFSTSVFAHTFSEVETTCPLDNTKFKSTEDMSGTQFGSQLDLKPLGPTPAPWRIPVCPVDHFVVYKDVKEFTSEEKEKLKKYIHSDDYQALVKEDSSTYFLLGNTFEFLKETPLKIAETYLKASWEVESNPVKYKKYASKSLQFFNEYLKSNPEKDEVWLPAHIVVGELYRRLGRYEEALKHFKSLNDREFKQAGLSAMIQYEIKLIKKQDSLPHAVPSKK